MCLKPCFICLSSANYGHCLLNVPKLDLLEGTSAVPNYPGEYFDADKQCEFVFGNGSRICSYMPPCGRLWCTTSGGEEQHGCRTQVRQKVAFPTLNIQVGKISSNSENSFGEKLAHGPKLKSEERQVGHRYLFCF